MSEDLGERLDRRDKLTRTSFYPCKLQRHVLKTAPHVSKRGAALHESGQGKSPGLGSQRPIGDNGLRLASRWQCHETTLLS